MKLRAKLILSFMGLAVVPLAAITIYSYNSSLHALQMTAEQESAAMATDMGSRMEEVSQDINRQIEWVAAAFEFRRIAALNEKDKAAAMQAFRDKMQKAMGENASFVRSMQFTPIMGPPLPPPPMFRMQPPVEHNAVSNDRPKDITLDFSGSMGPAGKHEPDKEIKSGNRQPPLFHFERFNTEVHNGNELVGKISAEISTDRLLRHVLMRTQPRQGEIPFAIDASGKPKATNPNDLKKIQALPLSRPGNKTGVQQQVTTVNNWVLVTNKDPQSGLIFGIARPIGDRLGDLQRTAARNLGFGILAVALAMIGIIPLSSRMTRNLSVLTTEAENLARGNLAARVPVASQDEFGTLALAFNHMAEDLSKNQKNLVEQERMHKELEMCRKIQEELLPRRSYRSGAIEVKGVSIPAREVGGDFFNYFPISNESFALLIGDVSGKGLPAALLMANLQATLQARLPLELDLVKLAEQLDKEIALNNAESYLTLFLAVLDLQSLQLRYVNAGHNPQFVLRNDGSLEQMESTGRPLGLLAGGGFQEKTVLLKNRDSLFFYTDGLVEAQNNAEEEFGMERLEALLIQERSKGLEGILANIEKTIQEYRGSVDAADDATLMLLKIGC
jgi:serine phosphatase RsbU (regulator of sigma subunit)